MLLRAAAVRLFVERARAAEPRLRARRRAPRAVARDLPAARRHSARDRAGRGARRARSASTGSPRGSTTASGCSPAAAAPRCRGSRRCGRRSTGATTCSPRPSASCCAASPSSPAASRSRRPRRSPARRSPRRTSSTASRTWSRSRWSSPDARRRGRAYRLLETTRAYALEKLAESGELEAPGAPARGILSRTCSNTPRRSGRRAPPPSGWPLRAADRQPARGAGLGFLPRGATRDRRGADSRGGAAVDPAVAHDRMPRARRARARQPRRRAGRDARREMQLHAALGVSLMQTGGAAPRHASRPGRPRSRSRSSLGDTEYQLRALWGLWHVPREPRRMPRGAGAGRAVLSAWPTPPIRPTGPSASG